MLVVREYQKRLREDAVSTRRQRPNGKPAEPVANVQGLRLKLGRLLIVVGTTLQDEDRPCPDMARS